MLTVPLAPVWSSCFHSCISFFFSYPYVDQDSDEDGSVDEEMKPQLVDIDLDLTAFVSFD